MLVIEHCIHFNEPINEVGFPFEGADPHHTSHVIDEGGKVAVSTQGGMFKFTT